MRRTDIVVIGAGQAGLAMSFCLARAGIDHVVLERGRIGERWRSERWRSERWDSLRLLTPNWMTRLPGHAYAGPDPDGFMAVAEFARLLETYAQGFAAPVLDEAAVTRVEPCSVSGPPRRHATASTRPTASTSRSRSSSGST